MRGAVFVNQPQTSPLACAAQQQQQQSSQTLSESSQQQQQQQQHAYLEFPFGSPGAMAQEENFLKPRIVSSTY